MGYDAPDGTLLMQVAVTVDLKSVPASAVTEKAIVALDRWTGTSDQYQPVVSYTVPAATSFILSGIEVACSDYTAGVFRLTIAGVEQFADKSLQTTFNPILPDVNLKAGDVILLEAHSDGATSITVDGSIEGKEVS